jgi:hypothetical protein
MQDTSNQHQVQSASALPTARSVSKQIGGYLVDAGLLTSDQISVALNDQQATGMRFGDIIVARGWLKEQTVEWIVSKVIEPERRQLHQRQAVRPQPGYWPSGQAHQAVPRNMAAAKPIEQPGGRKVGEQKAAAELKPAKSFARREAPISKPLPSVGSSDGDVNWVG